MMFCLLYLLEIVLFFFFFLHEMSSQTVTTLILCLHHTTVAELLNIVGIVCLHPWGFQDLMCDEITQTHPFYISNCAH